MYTILIIIFLDVEIFFPAGGNFYNVCYVTLLALTDTKKICYNWVNVESEVHYQKWWFSPPSLGGIYGKVKNSLFK